MGLFDGLAETLSGISPQQLLGTPLGNAGQGAAAIGAGAAGGTPATVPPQAATPEGAPSPAQPAPAGASVGGPTTPPDLSALYGKLLSDERSRRNTDQGLALIAAGFAAPQNRAPLISYASHAGDQDGTASQQLQSLLSLQQNSYKYAILAAQRARLPQIAKELNIPVDQAQSLLESGKLDEVMSKRNTIDATPIQNADGTHTILDKNTGLATSQPFGPLSTEITKNAANQPVSVVKATGQQVGAPVGPTSNDVDNLKQTDKSKILYDAVRNPSTYGLPDLAGPDYNTPEGQDKWNKFRAGLFQGGVNIYNQAENQEQSKIGAGRGDIRVDAMKKGPVASEGINTLNLLEDALSRGGGNTFGPLADGSIKSRQVLSQAFGVDFPELGPAETANKLQFTLATQAVKAISQRPSQMEFVKGLQNVPGTTLSPAGNKALIDLNRQQYQAQQDLAQMAQDPANDKKNWQEIENKYYTDHPLKSPFDHSKTLGQSDIDQISGAPVPGAQKAPDGKWYVKKDGKTFRVDQ